MLFAVSVSLNAFNETGEGTFVPTYTDDFLEEYRETHRGVMEYKLNLVFASAD